MLKRTYLYLVLVLLTFSCNNDDDLVAVCDSVSNISADNITNSSATISWDAVNSTALYEVEFGPNGFMQGTGSTTSVTDPNITLSGLVASTTYDVYIQTVCATNNVSVISDVFSFTTLAPNVIPEFRVNMSEMNLFIGDMSNLEITPYAFEYNLNTQLFTDYAHKQRFIALPPGEKMTYDGDGLPLYPDNTLIAKTFYYNNDERDLSLGRQIIETRILIKIDGDWVTGDYKWNEAQDDAVLDLNGSIVPVTWIDAEGESNSLDYAIPSDTDCFTCHRIYNDKSPIGPKLRTLNFEVNGINQLQQLIDSDMLDGLSDPSTVSVLPNWEDASYSLEERARAYFDVNCAHCHIEGGFCEVQSTLRLAFETDMASTNIAERRNSIINRMSFYNQGFSMPWIGTTIIHDEGLNLILDYLDTIE